jgi:hypothetical protein
MHDSVWEVPRSSLDLPTIPTPQDADWLFRFNPDGTTSIFLRTPGMAIQTPVMPRWSYENSTLVFDWTDQLPIPQETHRQLLAFDQDSVTWLCSSGKQERWTRAQIPANAIKSFANHDQPAPVAPVRRPAAVSLVLTTQSETGVTWRGPNGNLVEWQKMSTGQ